MSQNMQYIQLVQSKLVEMDFPRHEIDALAQRLVLVADEQGFNVISFIDDYIANNIDELRRMISRDLAAHSKGTFFTTTRYGKPKPSKFIRRQILTK